ncbi:MAG: glycosyltransferase [Acidobacteria bacterium]|nr:glycosyltransferase [Acidobacteriota bacterium]
MSLPMSVLICTHNRASQLDGALRSLESQSLFKDSFEVLVVDNASTDATREVFGDCAGRGKLNLRYVKEMDLGLDAARNRGIREARGEIVAFLDDDARARADWAEAILTGFAQHKAPILGGRVDLIWEAERPGWFSDALLKYLIHCDYGDRVLEVTAAPWLYGTNVAFRKELFQEIGLFRLDLDRKGESLMGGGDTEFFHRARARGKTLLYLPSMVVGHLVPAKRLTREFFRERLFYSGFTRAAHGTESLGRVLANCALFASAGPLFAVAALALRLAGLPRQSFAQERRALLAFGYLYYCLLKAGGRVPPPRQEVWT